MACERSCSVTVSDRCVMSQNHSFAFMLGVAGATHPILMHYSLLGEERDAVLMQLCSL